MATSIPRIFEFGRFRLDPAERLLVRDGIPVPLQPKSFDVLELLVERRGHLVSKRELLEAVWPGSFVEENNLNQQITALRRVLGSGGGESYIQTVSKAGFRFIAPPMSQDPPSLAPERPAAETDDEATAAPRPESRPASARAAVFGGLLLLGIAVLFLWHQASAHRTHSPVADIRTLAVLPFRDLSPVRAVRPIGLGLADAMITRLGELRRLVVRPTTSVLPFGSSGRDSLSAGRNLRVDAVLDGSVQVEGDRLRITAQLLRVRDGATLWSQKFDQRSTDVLEAEDRISESLAILMQPPEPGGLPRSFSRKWSQSPEANQAYLRGRFLWSQRTPESLRESAEAFAEAIARDQRFALAYAGLSDCELLMGTHGVSAPREIFPKAEASARRALELDDGLAGPHASLGFVRLFFDWDWKSAGAEFERAIALEPNSAVAHHWYASYWMSIGHSSRALSEIDLAERLDPLSLQIRAARGWNLILAGRPDDAIQELQATVQMSPDFAMAREDLGIAFTEKKMCPEADSEFRREGALTRNAPYARLDLAREEAICGNAAAANTILSEVEGGSGSESVSAVSLAIVRAALGERDEAFRCLEKAFGERASGLVWLAVDPRFGPLASDSRFAAMMRRVGIPARATSGLS